MDFDLSNEQGIRKFDTYMSEYSYVNKWIPSSLDIHFFKQLGKLPENKFPNLIRWYKHIESFTEAEFSQWEKITTKVEEKKVEEEEEEDDDDDFDCFGEETEEEEAARIASIEAKRKEIEAKMAAYKGNKSNLVIDIKPWDDETDLVAMEEAVRKIDIEGLMWGQSKLVPVGYGIKKLTIACQIIDDLVATDDIEEKVTEIEDFVQSMDIAAFNKA